MWDFVVKYWVEFALGLIASGLGIVCKHLIKEQKRYKELVTAEQQKKQDDHIDEKLTPILNEIEQIRTYLITVQNEDSKKFDIIISSYRFRLCQLCKIYLDRGYMTPSDYEQLNEFYKTYTALGGNGAAKEWYDKVKVLPVHDHPVQK